MTTANAPVALAACPFCGWKPPRDEGDNLIDVVYPTGSYAHYIDPQDPAQGLHYNRDRRDAVHALYHVGCTGNMGGCDASVYGNDRSGAIAAWNRRATLAQAAPDAEGVKVPQGIDPVEAYAARVGMLRIHAARAKKVTEADILEIASMEPDELRRRAIVARDWHSLFASCLDGLPLEKYSGAPDGCWFPDHIRRVVEKLIAAPTAGAGVAVPEQADLPADLAAILDRNIDKLYLRAALPAVQGAEVVRDALSEEWILELAHRMASTYAHRTAATRHNTATAS